jgi:hypothetical protein
LEAHLRRVQEKREQWAAGEEERRKNPGPLMKYWEELKRKRMAEWAAKEKGETRLPPNENISED